jgi:catechol 2,3-dioxygenase-like lactoylglutathione lyase family enzyme
MGTVVEVAYFTDQLEAMTAFYQQVLESEPVEKSEGMTVFQSGTTKIFLHALYQPGENDLPPVNHLAVAVKDVDQACQKLSESGLAVEIAPKDFYWGRSAYLRDPDGHQVELAQTHVNWSQAHRYFSADCYNRAWDLIDKAERTPEENERMISTSHASMYHWLQRPDCTNLNLNIGYWQLSRVYALANQAANALHYGHLCLKYSQGEEPFYTAYAYEALARAEKTAGNVSKTQEYLAKAYETSEQIENAEYKQMVLGDLKTIES